MCTLFASSLAGCKSEAPAEDTAPGKIITTQTPKPTEKAETAEEKASEE